MISHFLIIAFAAVQLCWITSCVTKGVSETTIQVQNSKGENIDYVYLQSENHVYLNQDVTKYDFFVDAPTSGTNQIVRIDNEKNRIIIKPIRKTTTLVVLNKVTQKEVARFDLKTRLVPYPQRILRSDSLNIFMRTEKNYLKQGQDLYFELEQEEWFLTLVPDDHKFVPKEFIWYHGEKAVDTVEIIPIAENKFVLKNPFLTVNDSLPTWLIFNGLKRIRQDNIIGESETYPIIIIK